MKYDTLSILPRGDTLMVAADPVYFVTYGPAFINSALHHGNKVHVHLVGLDDSIIPVHTRFKYNRNVTFSFEDITPETANREHYASARFHVAPDLLFLEPTLRLLLLDIDSVVRDRIDFPDAAVGLYLREPFGASEWERRGTRVAAGAVFYDNTAWYFAEQVSNRIHNLEKNWFIDQIALAETYDDFKMGLRVHDFSQDNPPLLDWEWREHAKVWSAKGPRKSDPNFVEEKKKYEH